MKQISLSWNYLIRIDVTLNHSFLCNHHHHHHVVPPARISLILSRHFSLSSIASGRSSGLHPVSSHSCCMYVRAGHPAFAWPYEGFHWSTSLMSSSLLLQHCPACLARLALIVFMMGGRWPCTWCFCGMLPPWLVQNCLQPSEGLMQCLTWSWTYESCGSAVRIVGSIGELLLLIYKGYFYRWE